MGLNSANAESTGKPPALRAFGQLSRLPVDILVGAREHARADQVATQVKTIMEEFKKQLKKAQKHQKSYFDAHHHRL